MFGEVAVRVMEARSHLPAVAEVTEGFLPPENTQEEPCRGDTQAGISHGKVSSVFPARAEAVGLWDSDGVRAAS